MNISYLRIKNSNKIIDICIKIGYILLIMLIFFWAFFCSLVPNYEECDMKIWNMFIYVLIILIKFMIMTIVINEHISYSVIILVCTNIFHNFIYINENFIISFICMSKLIKSYWIVKHKKKIKISFAVNKKKSSLILINIS